MSGEDREKIAKQVREHWGERAILVEHDGECVIAYTMGAGLTWLEALLNAESDRAEGAFGLAREVHQLHREVAAGEVNDYLGTDCDEPGTGANADPFEN